MKCENPMKIANPLLSTCTEIHIPYYEYKFEIEIQKFLNKYWVVATGWQFNWKMM